MSLINMANIPNNQISGESDEMLQWLESESMERYVSELSRSFREELEEIEVYEDVDEEILQTIREAVFHVYFHIIVVPICFDADFHACNSIAARRI